MSALSREDLADYSHEMRGALAVIAGYAELLRRPLDAAARDAALDGLDRAVRRVDGLLSDALAGRPLATPSPSAFVPLSLALIAEQVAEDHRATTGRTIDVTLSATPEVLGDEGTIASLLGNLIDNAAKYSLSRSPVEVRIAQDEGPSGRVAVIEVADRGPGIPGDEVDRILEPSVRLDRDANLPGTGLGLGIVRAVVAAHGGTLSLNAREGGGTVVRMEFPQV